MHQRRPLKGSSLLSVGRMERVEHHDATRAGVSSTAVAVACGRAFEAAKPNPLVVDPFARLFCPMDVMKR
jgi:O-methyltransferase involved in polyketide biosynthesis